MLYIETIIPGLLCSTDHTHMSKQFLTPQLRIVLSLQLMILHEKVYLTARVPNFSETYNGHIKQAKSSEDQKLFNK